MSSIYSSLILSLFISLQGHADAALDAAQKSYPDKCKIKSSEMRFVWACRGLSSTTSKLYTVQEPGPLSRANGANFCYNSFVMIDEKPGFPITAKVLRDSGENLRVYSYQARENALPKSPDIEPVMSFKDLDGTCFFYRNPQKPCTAVNMAFKLQRAGDSLLPGEMITDRNELKDYAEKGLITMGHTDTAEIRKVLVNEMKSRLNSFSDRTLNGFKNGVNKAAISAYRECSEAFNQFTQDKKLDPKWSADENKRFADLNRYIDNGKIQEASAVGIAQ